MDENDYISTGSHINSVEEPEYSQKSEENQGLEDDQIQNGCQSEEGVLKSEDLETMVQNYKQIGGELMYNLKILENKRRTLNKQLTDISRECDILNQQKDFQMKTLVDLQIKLENLDTERIKIWEDNETDKTEKAEVLYSQLQSLLENDEYLRNTFDKFQDVLKSEKVNFEQLFWDTRNACEEHKKTGEEYLKEINGINQTFYRAYNDLCEHETRLIEELDLTIDKCRELISEELKIHQELDQKENEYKQKSLTYKNLEQNFNESIGSLNAAHKNYSEVEKVYNEKIDEINNNILQMNKECDELAKEFERQTKMLSEKNVLLGTLSQDVKLTNAQLLKTQEDNNQRQQELDRLNEECNFLNEKISQEIIEQGLLNEKAGMLQALEESLKNKCKIENELQICIEKLLEKKEACVKEVELVKQEQLSLEGNLHQVELEREEWNLKLKEAEKEESETSVRLNLLIADSENKLAEKNKEHNELALIIEKNQSIKTNIDQEISLAEQSIKDFVYKMKEIEKEFEELDDEDVKLKTREVEMEQLKEKTELFEKELAKVNKELEELTKTLTESQQIKDLECELNKVDLERKELTLHYKGQIEAIESSFVIQQQNLEERFAKEIKEIEKRAAKAEAHTKRMSEALPRLTNDVGILEADLKKSLPSLIKEISSALETLDRVADYYYKLALERRRKGSKASIGPTLSAIEEQLSKPMKCMMSLEGVPKLSLDDPVPDTFKNIITAFRKKHAVIFKQIDKNPPLEMAIKLQEIGSCVFGKKWVHKPSYSQAQNDAEISSSTTEIFY